MGGGCEKGGQKELGREGGEERRGRAKKTLVYCSMTDDNTSEDLLGGVSG